MHLAVMQIDVHLHGFTPKTMDWLAGIIEHEFGHPRGKDGWVPLPSAAALYFLLRSLSEDAFPGGKWATVQHLETLIIAAVREAKGWEL
jgi:hypothetical protein